jgi:hypothetical protein
MNKQFTNDDGFKVISIYTDHEACEGGVLVPIAARDRVTRAVWDYLLSRENVNPGGTEDKRHDRALFTSGRMIGQHALEAKRVYKENIGDGIFTFIELGRKMWIIPNEIGGLTLMFPEDY